MQGQIARNRKWWTLAAVAFTVFMTAVDNTVVNVALPSIRSDLGFSQSALEWVVNGYILAFATLLLTGGRLGDLFGRSALSWPASRSSPPPRSSAASRAPS